MVEQEIEALCVGSSILSLSIRANRIVAIAAVCKTALVRVRKFESYFAHLARDMCANNNLIIKLMGT